VVERLGGVPLSRARPHKSHSLLFIAHRLSSFQFSRGCSRGRHRIDTWRKKFFLAVFPENDPPALFDRRGACLESSSCTATDTARIHLWRYVVERNEAGGFRYEKILSVRIPRPAHLPRFRHSHDGTGLGSAHRPFFASRAFCSGPSSTVSPGAYFRYHLTYRSNPVKGGRSSCHRRVCASKKQPKG
jgi:hypothetical protein